MSDRILCTFPGRAGDLLWALPTVRAISETVGQPVDLQIAGEFAAMTDLLLAQPYLKAVWPDERWGLSQGWEAPRLPQDYARVIHLGYRRWPELPLAQETYERALAQVPGLPRILDLDRPWITVDPWTQVPHRLVLGWSDCYFELKYGISELLALNWPPATPMSGFLLAAPGSRWTTEAECEAVDWLEAARRTTAADVFLGDCSALHVLAVACGKPVVLVEPMEARWNPIFYPLGMDGRVRVVKGLDGRPTFDARHVADTLREVLR